MPSRPPFLPHSAKMAKPLCVDLFCGLGGWAEGALAAGYEVVGFDIERHRIPTRKDSSGNLQSAIKVGGIDFNGYGTPGYKAVAFNSTAVKRLGPTTGGWDEYPGQLVIQDVLTLHGSQFRDAALIVASPPCQNYSYLAMPWSRSADPNNSKAAKALRKKWETEGPDNRLFDACSRIQREAIDSTVRICCGKPDCARCGGRGWWKRYIPLIVENVRGAQPWVGRAKANFGSYYLWGDVAQVGRRIVAGVPEFGAGMSRGLAIGTSPAENSDGTKGGLATGGWFNDYMGEKCVGLSASGSKSSARKQASALIAKIPFQLACYIATSFHPR